MKFSLRSYMCVVVISVFSSPALADNPQNADFTIYDAQSGIGGDAAERLELRLRTAQADASSCLGDVGEVALAFRLTVSRQGRVSEVVETDAPPNDAHRDVARCLRRVLREVSFEPREQPVLFSVRVSNGRRMALARVGTIGVQSGSSSTATSMTGPQIPAGRAIVRGSLAREVIREVIGQHINQVRYCYERELHGAPELHGRFVARFIIGSSGSVQSATITSDTLGSPPVAQCVVQVMLRMRFPAPTGGGIVIVNYPFAFQSSDVASSGAAEGSMNNEAQVQVMSQSTGRLPRSAILRVVRRHQRAVRSCYERELQHDQSFEGRLRVRFVILSTGRVGSVTLPHDTLGNAALSSCVVRQVRRWRFPQPEGGEVTVVYPFVFTTSD